MVSIEQREKVFREIRQLMKPKVTEEYEEGYNDGLLDAMHWMKGVLDKLDESSIPTKDQKR